MGLECSLFASDGLSGRACACIEHEALPRQNHKKIVVIVIQLWLSLTIKVIKLQLQLVVAKSNYDYKLPKEFKIR